MPRDKTRIYLSSTFDDLKAHRAAVHTALTKAGFDVQSMEHYTASDQRPVDKCLHDVAEADYYLGLFAFRYGYVPPVEHGNAEGLSITELEYRRAAASTKPRFIFFADGDSDEQAWPKKFDDCHTGAAESGAALGRFKQHLGREHLCTKFSTPDNLAASVQAAISQWSFQASASRGSAAAEAAAPVRWNIAEQQSPFPGLQHFAARHATVYFGREADVDTLLFRLRQGANRFIVVSGGSGTGKSSLVDAGLRHALTAGQAAAQAAGQATAVRPPAFQRMLPTAGADLWDALARALKPQAEALGQDDFALAAAWREAPSTLGAGLGRLARGPSGQGELVLLLDQMEELFTGRADEPRTRQADAFLSALHAAAQDAAHGLRVVGTMRSDFLHHCHHHPALKACLNGSAHHALGRAQPWMLKDMIVKPAEAAGLSFEPGLVDQLLEDAGQQTGSLPLLAFALNRLFETREGTQLTRAAYQGMEGLDGAIRTQVAQAEADLKSQLGDAAEATLKHLFPRLLSISPEGIVTRQRVKRADLSAAEGQAVRVLEARRLLAGEGEGAEGAAQGVSVAHERLFRAWPQLKAWIDNSQGQLIELRRAEHAAALWSAKDHALAYQWPLEQLRGVQQAIEAFAQLPHSENLREFAQPQWPLIRRLERPEAGHRERDDIGKLLAALGDPRPGVALRPDGLPDIVWVPVPGGTLRLEHVDHDFEVQPFEMARYPVTHAQFQAFIDAPDGWHDRAWWAGLSRPDEPGEAGWPLPNHPRETVNWYEAVAFCRWLDARWRAAAPGMAGQIRLPTEWEWQQAATRGNPGNSYPWGPDWDARLANSYESATRRTTAVGMYPLGAALMPRGMSTERIEDLAGNVWEWCLNKHDDPAEASALRLDKSEASRVLRGGSWFNLAGDLRASRRGGNHPDDRTNGIGFRVCRASPI